MERDFNLSHNDIVDNTGLMKQLQFLESESMKQTEQEDTSTALIKGIVIDVIRDKVDQKLSQVIQSKRNRPATTSPKRTSVVQISQETPERPFTSHLQHRKSHSAVLRPPALGCFKEANPAVVNVNNQYEFTENPKKDERISSPKGRLKSLVWMHRIVESEETQSQTSLLPVTLLDEEDIFLRRKRHIISRERPKSVKIQIHPRQAFLGHEQSDNSLVESNEVLKSSAVLKSKSLGTSKETSMFPKRMAQSCRSRTAKVSFWELQDASFGPPVTKTTLKVLKPSSPKRPLTCFAQAKIWTLERDLVEDTISTIDPSITFDSRSTIDSKENQSRIDALEVIVIRHIYLTI